MLISVVIPTCDRPAELAACLARLAPGAQTLAATEYEVIVTDDGQRSAEAALAKQFPWVTWVAGPRRGPAANRNCGARQARGEWLAFTDDDCEPDAGWLKAFALVVEAGEARVLEGRTSPTGERSRLDMECPANESGGCLWSCNFAIEKALFESVGGFDEEFPGAAIEDIDLHWRLREQGIAAQFVREARIGHAWRPRKGRRQQWLAARSVAYLVAKHPAARAQFSPTAITVGLARALGSHLPRAMKDVGVRGLSREVALAVHKSFALFVECNLRRKLSVREKR
jgi:GT2 family glycosyltransferase